MDLFNVSFGIVQDIVVNNSQCRERLGHSLLISPLSRK
jgi:hypothetical protein